MTQVPAPPRHPVAGQLIVRLTFIGLVLGLVTGAGQLAVEYRRDLAALEARFDEVEASYLPSVRENAWLDDRERLGTLAEGIRHLPGIVHVEMFGPDGAVVASAGSPASQPMVRSYDISRDYAGRPVPLGLLKVTAGLETLQQGVMRRLWLILGGDFVLVFALAGVLYWQVHSLVTGRLKAMAGYARRLGKDGPSATPVLDLGPAAGEDEFTDLGQALTRMHTDIARAHDALAASEARYRELFTSSPVPLWEQDFTAVAAVLDELRPRVTEFGPWLDANPEVLRRCAGLVRVVDVNHAAIAMHRASSAGDLLTRLTAVFAPASYDAFRKQLEAIFDGRHDLTLDTQVRTLDGDVVETVLHWHVPPSYRANFARVIVSLEDVTALKGAQRASEVTLERLMQANAELERFTFVASHDLQEPVRAVVSFTQLLERRLREATGLSADTAEFLGFLRAAAERMQAQVAGLHDYTRAGQTLGAFVPLHLGDALADARLLLEASFASEGATVEAAALPMVVGDRTQLADLFRQLLDNALKFRHPDRPLVVAVSAAPADGGWRITVRDNGIGIDPTYAATVFEAFRRLHGPGHYPGAGLGLAICRRIVERHGGSIAIETNQKGDGTAVTFTLPATDLVRSVAAA